MNPNQLRHYGVEVQDNPYDPRPMIIRKEDPDDGDFVACLKSQGTNIYIDTWTPTDKDLRNYPQVVLTSSRTWDPYEVKFPGISEVEMSEIEDRNISGIGVRQKGGPELRGINFGDGYCRPIKNLDIRAFNARIMKSQIIFGCKLHLRHDPGDIDQNQHAKVLGCKEH